MGGAIGSGWDAAEMLQEAGAPDEAADPKQDVIDGQQIWSEEIVMPRA